MTPLPPKPLPVFSMQPEKAGYTIYRDAAVLETPRNLPVTVPTQRLAEAILAECRAQDERLDLRAMPITQMTLTALDITSRQRKEIIDGIVRYGETELLCQRAGEPADLVAAQEKVWQPYLDWARENFKANLVTGTGVVPFAQNPAALDALRSFVATHEPFRLTGISEAVGLSGSLILGLALATDYADAATVLAAAELDQQWQVQKFGEDPVIAARHADIRRELEDCARWFSLLD